MNLHSSLFRSCLACVLLSVLFLNLFSVTVQAEEQTLTPSDLSLEVEEQTLTPSVLSLTDEDFTSGDMLVQHAFYMDNGASPYVLVPYREFTNGLTTSGTMQKWFRYVSYDNACTDRVSLKFSDGRKMVSKKNALDIEISNLRNFIYINDTNYETIYATKNLDPNYVWYIRVYFRDINGNYKNIDCEEFEITSSMDNYYNLSLSNVQAPCDTYEIYIDVNYPMNAYDCSAYCSQESYCFTRTGGFMNTKINVTEKEYDEKVGLLQRIVNSVTGMWDSIKELPGKIADFIIDGIKNLFVPTQEDITAMKDKWNQLLEDRFGALYQTGTIINQYVNSFSPRAQSTITMPVVSIPVAGSTFTFGGYQVTIIPDKFNVVINTLKTVISIVATILFVNGLKNRFEKLLGGSSNV